MKSLSRSARRRRAILLAAAVVGLPPLVSALPAAQANTASTMGGTGTYTAEVLSFSGPPTGSGWTTYDAVASGINDSGAIAGTASGQGDSTTYQRAFVSTQGPGTQWLSTPGPNSSASGIGRTGEVVGGFDRPESEPFSWQPAYWSSTGEYRALTWQNPQKLVPVSLSARAVNGSGRIVGSASGGAGMGSSVSVMSWASFSGMASLPTESSSTRNHVTAITDAGQVYGQAVGPSWDPPTSTGAVFDGNTARVFAKPAGTQTTITAVSPNGTHRVGLMTQTASMWEMGANDAAVFPLDGETQKLPGANFSPTAVNDVGVVVGTHTRTDGTTRAMMWRFEQATDLNDVVRGLPSGLSLVSAVGVNRWGTIAATAQDGAGRTYAVRLSPVLR